MRLRTLFPLALLVLTVVGFSGCGGPDQATITSIAEAEQRLSASGKLMETGDLAAVLTTWETAGALMTKHQDVVIDGRAVQTRLNPIKDTFRPLMDTHAAEWVTRYADDPAVWPRLQNMAREVGATRIGEEHGRYVAEQAKIAAAKQAAERERQERERLAALDGLPHSILVVAKLSPDLPRSVSSQSDRLLSAVVDALRQRLSDIPVLRLNKDMPLGSESCAAATVEVLVTCEYASYARRGAHEFEAMLGAAVPTTLTLRMRSRPGRFCDLALDRTLSATKSAQDEVAAQHVEQLAKNHADSLIGEVLGKFSDAFPAWDPVALKTALAATPEFHMATAPVVTIECKTQVGKEKGQPNHQVFAATGSGELASEMASLVARRIGPVRLVTGKPGAGSAHVLIENTIYYRSYGTTNGMIATNNGSLPYRADVNVTMTSSATPAHPWTGRHRYAAFVDLPEQVSRSGGFASEGVAAIATMSDQIGEALEVELMLARAYRPSDSGEPDQYLLRVLPTGRFESDAVLKTTWFRTLPAKIQTSLKTRLAPDVVVVSSAMTPGRVAGLITVFADGELVGVHRPGVAAVLEPMSLSLETTVSSAFRATPHAWEGTHPIAVKINTSEVSAAMNRQQADPLDGVLMKAIRAAYK